MSYLTGRLNKVGITAATPRAAVAQAMLIGSAAAIETAINVSITGIGWAIKFEMSETDPEVYRDYQKRAIMAFLDEPEVKAASFRLKQLKYEGC